MFRSLFAAVVLVLMLAGCGSEAPKPAAEAENKPDAEKRPDAAAIPEEVQKVAKKLLGSDAQVLLYGDLAKNGMQELLAGNVVPNTPKSVVAGTVVTRAVVAENDDGKCEHAHLQRRAFAQPACAGYRQQDRQQRQS